MLCATVDGPCPHGKCNSLACLTLRPIFTLGRRLRARGCRSAAAGQTTSGNSLALPDVGAHFHGSEAAGAAALRQRARQRLASLASGKLLERKRYHCRGDF